MVKGERQKEPEVNGNACPVFFFFPFRLPKQVSTEKKRFYWYNWEDLFVFAERASCRHSLHPKMCLPAVQGPQHASSSSSSLCPTSLDTLFVLIFLITSPSIPPHPGFVFFSLFLLSSAVVWERVELGACSFWQGKEAEVN